jgi:hypothetical protein
MQEKHMDYDIGKTPEEQGMEECPHCNGHGSSFKDPIGVNDCTRCKPYGGHGVVPKKITVRDSLVAYVKHVGDREGVDFISSMPDTPVRALLISVLLEDDPENNKHLKEF